MIARITLVLSAMVVSAPALAEPWDCIFTVECPLGADCREAGFEVQIIAADHEGQLFASSIMGETPITRLTARATLPASYASTGQAGLAELLTVEPDQTAIMTVHFVDGATSAVTYLGTCTAF